MNDKNIRESFNWNVRLIERQSEQFEKLTMLLNNDKFCQFLSGYREWLLEKSSQISDIDTNERQALVNADMFILIDALMNTDVMSQLKI